MKVIKRIFVGSIILLLMATTLIAAAGAGVHKNTQETPMNVTEQYSLGTWTIRHQPMFWNYRDRKGMDVIFEPVDSYHFNFTEINGSVFLNFTLTINHYLNYPGTIPYFLEFIFRTNFRYTVVNRWWINEPNGPDLISIKNSTPCISTEVETYTITGTALCETNGENKTLIFMLFGGPGLSPIPFIQDMILLFRGVNRNWLIPHCDINGQILITIHPIPV